MTQREFTAIVRFLEGAYRTKLDATEAAAYFAVLKAHTAQAVMAEAMRLSASEESRYGFPKPGQLVPLPGAQGGIRLRCPHCRELFTGQQAIRITSPDGLPSEGYFDHTEGRFVLPPFQAHVRDCNPGLSDVPTEKLHAWAARLQNFRGLPGPARIRMLEALGEALLARGETLDLEPEVPFAG